MIPVRLELKNFMSYGTQVMPIEFTGMHLACLSGENGNGKSALLDAITWALWGEARASSDELIRLGADEMRVSFDFLLGGDLYRVIRARSKRNSGNMWEIYIAENGRVGEGESGGVGDDAPSPSRPLTPSSPEWRPLTGQGIRDTAKVIQRILRMDYKTFVNSAYIQQGRADEFTKQTVADRKKILADILNLSRYDVLEQKAKDRRNQADQQVQELGREIEHVEAELAGEDGWKSQLAEAQEEQGKLEAQIAEVEEKVRGLQARRTELESTARRVQELRQQIVAWRREIENLLTQKTEQERRVAAAREIIVQRDDILSGREKLLATRERIAGFDSRLESLRTLEHRKAGLDQQILAEKHRLDLDRRSLAKELSELESKIAAASTIEKDAESLRLRTAELDSLDSKRAELQAKVTESADRLGALKAQHDGLRDEVKPDLEQKLAMIAEPGAKCPLCRTELGHEKHQEVVAQYQRDIAELDRRIADLKKQGAQAKADRDSAQQEQARIDEQLKAGLEVRRRLAQAEQVLFQTEEYRKQLPGVRARLDAVSKSLESDDFAADARASLADAVSQIAALAYDADEHRRMKESLAALDRYESLAIRLKHAEEGLPADESNLRAIGELIGAREKSIADAEQSASELSASAQELTAVTEELGLVSGSLATLREQDRTLAGRIATLQNSLRRCEELRAQVSEKRKALDTAKRDKAVYTELVGAFGKKGVQALIIENAIPEIQEEANRLLARMTDNAMQVSIDTVRDKKTGGTAETLDIKISDDMGTRSYELYSGGEAFRVNFALRIALSKLLARRAGARLQTLIIDEGFGTQDGKGREKLVEAIDSIKDDFELVLVITHIDELKDAFPTRIEVTKDSSGSQIALN